MNSNKKLFIHHYSKIMKCIKNIVDDDELTDEEKIRLLGIVL